MDYYVERLEQELKKILSFWMKNIISIDAEKIYAEYTCEGKPNKSADMGSLFLSRVMLGATSACQFLNTQEFKPLADLAFKILYEKFRNPAGGFYWAKNSRNEVIHDSDNVNMAQAFLLNGLTEYAMLTNNPVVVSEMKKQQQFIINTLKDTKNGGYLDGFNMDWKQEKTFTKSLGTHLHLMEALVKQYEFTREDKLIPIIIELIEILSDKFYDKHNNLCLHRFSVDWNVLPNQNWAGHNAEMGWLLCHASKAINNVELQRQSCYIEQKLSEAIIEKAFDKSYGGVFNEIGNDGEPVNLSKDWWPQAETAIAMLYAYECSKDKTFLSYGIRLIEYIENTFSDSHYGEWHSSVSREGMPISGEAKIHFWKSLYHNVRYCIELSTLLKRLIR